MMITSRPVNFGYVAKKPMTPTVRFGACVNAAIKKEQFQELLLVNSWAERLHAIASVGGNGKEAVVDAISTYILRQEKLSQAPLRGDVLEFSILALTESSLKNKGLKGKILDTLNQAKDAKHLRAQRAFIEEAIAKVQHDGKKESSKHWQEAEQAYVKDRHGHAFGQGGHQHH